MKKVLIVLTVLGLLGVGGYFYMNSKGMAPKLPGAMMGNNAAGGGNVFTSIKDALSQSLSLKCVYKDEQGVESTTYIKGGAVRVMMSGTADTEQPNNIIMKDKKMHMWSDTSKTGFTFAVEEPKNISPFPTSGETTEADDKSGADQSESLLATIEKYKDACKAEVVADSMFAIPTDVTFQDMNALQEQMMKDIPKAPPQGAEGSSVDYEKYLNEIMKQQGQ